MVLKLIGGISSSGKTTYATYLQQHNENSIILAKHKYFLTSKINYNNAWQQYLNDINKCLQTVSNISMIIIDCPLLTKQERKEFLQGILYNIDTSTLDIDCSIFKLPLDIILLHNLQRNPNYIITNPDLVQLQLSHTEIPTLDEFEKYHFHSVQVHTLTTEPILE